MITGEKEVEDYREMFLHITGDELLVIKLRNNFTQCWNIHRGVPSCIHNRCISCGLAGKTNCNTCNWGTMCALEILHRPDFCVWPKMFISTPIKLGGIPKCSKIIFTCNMRSKKFQSWTEGDSCPSDIYLMGFAHLLHQCSRIEKVPWLSMMMNVYMRKRPLLCTLLPACLKLIQAEWAQHLGPFEHFLSESAVKNRKVAVLVNWC